MDEMMPHVAADDRSRLFRLAWLCAFSVIATALLPSDDLRADDRSPACQIRITRDNDSIGKFVRRKWERTFGCAASCSIRICPPQCCDRSCEALIPTTPQVAIPVPRHEVQQLGTSVLGVPIVVHQFGSVGPKTLIFAAIHGDEPTTAFVAHRLIETLVRDPALFADRQVAVIPVANPDGLSRRTRTNAREVDLNRNFPATNFSVGKRGRYFGGELPASEPETQTLIKLIEDWKPQRIVSLHAIARGRHGNNFDGPAEPLARLLSQHNNYKVLSSIGYPTPGSFGSWSGVDRLTPTITLELPSDASGEACWTENRDALLAAIQAE